MSSLALRSNETKVKTNIILSSTKLITQEDIDYDPNWRQVHLEYRECKDSEWLIKATVSLFNAIYHQKRKAFCLSRSSLRDILKSDKNWIKPIGLKDAYYRKFLDHIFRSKLFENVPYEKHGHKLMVLKIIHPELLAMFNFDIDAQLSEALDFAKRDVTKNKADTKKEKIFKPCDKEEAFKVTLDLPKNSKDAFDLLKDQEQVIIEKVYGYKYRTKEWRSLMDNKRHLEVKALERAVLDNFAFEYLKMTEKDKISFISEGFEK